MIQDEHPPLLVDACVAINLRASGRCREVVAASRRRIAMPEQSADEVLYVLDDNGDRQRLPLRDLATTGLFELWEFERDEAELMIELAAELGAGEAACLAIGARRGVAIATDDRFARRRARQLLGADTELLTTGELMRSWASRGVSRGDIAACLRLIESRAKFQPPLSDPTAEWWRQMRNN